MAQSVLGYFQPSKLRFAIVSRVLVVVVLFAGFRRI